jgi:carboxyl-terminal processing protease
MFRSPALKVPVFIIALIVASSLAAAPGSVGTAAAADLSPVFRAVEILRDEHVARPDPLHLLAAAVDGLREALAGIAVAAVLPDLTAADKAGARAQFEARFAQALAAAGGRLAETDLQHAAIRAMTASLRDSHTAFISPERLAEIERQRRGEPGFVGIGILLTLREGRFVVRLVFPGSPAERAGLRPFDRIVAIDGRSTEGMAMRDVVARVRGPEGTTVTIAVKRPGQPEPLSFAIARAPIAVPPVEHRMLEEPGRADARLGYIRFGSFAPGAAAYLRRAVQDLQGRGMRGLILDLRLNSGGFLLELNLAADLLLPAGLPIYTVDSRHDGRRTATTRGEPTLDPAIPLVVLTDEGTASAGEMLAAALRDHGRAILVGARTAGAALVARTFPLPGGSAINVAIAHILTPRGAVLEGNGLRPDIEIALTIDDLDRGVDSQMDRAREEMARRLAGAERAEQAVGMGIRQAVR